MFNFLKKNQKQRVDVRVENNDTVIILRAFVRNQWVMQMICVPYEEKILISDIQPRDWDMHSQRNKYINKGYSSMLMSALIQYAKSLGITHLYGNLSCNDLGHKDRLHHFYQKFGFNIIEYDCPQDNYYGKIEKYL